MRSGQPREGDELSSVTKTRCAAVTRPICPCAGPFDLVDGTKRNARIPGADGNGTIMKTFAVTVAVLALGLAACESKSEEAAENETNIENAAEADANAATVDASNAADSALDAAGNAVENAGEAVENAADSVESSADNAAE